jgi:hypothetical protein
VSDDLTSAAVAVEAPAGEPLTYDGAVARKAELMKTPGYADRWLNNEITARREMAEVNAALVKGAPDPGRIARELAVSKGSLSEFQKKEYVEQIPVTREQHDGARRMIQDRDFLRQWGDGDPEAKHKMELLAQVLNRPIEEVAKK